MEIEEQVSKEALPNDTAESLPVSKKKQKQKTE